MNKNLPKVGFRNLIPNKNNLFIWLNAIFLILLLIFKIADPITIVMAYFLETIIIGIVNIFKMYKVQSTNLKEQRKYWPIIFFTFHYSFFVIIQLIFVFEFLRTTDSNLKHGFYLLYNINYVLSLKGMIWVLASILTYNLGNFYFNFIHPKVYEKISTLKLFITPYPRIIIQQLAVLLAGFFIISNSKILTVAILLIIVRAVIELFFLISTQFVFYKIQKEYISKNQVVK